MLKPKLQSAVFVWTCIGKKININIWEMSTLGRGMSKNYFKRHICVWLYYIFYRAITIKINLLGAAFFTLVQQAFYEALTLLNTFWFMIVIVQSRVCTGANNINLFRFHNPSEGVGETPQFWCLNKKICT